MDQFEKWIEGISPDQPVVEAAQHSVRVRLATVQHYLPLAANRSDKEVEYVHQLRVFTRRSMAALELYTDLLPKKEVKWCTRKLRKIRRVAGNARDLDVLAQSHEADSRKGSREFLKYVRQRREAAQRPIAKIYRNLEKRDRLNQQIKHLLGKPVKCSEGTRFGSWASHHLLRILKRFCKAVPSDDHDLAALHRFRIRGKELRYAVELLSSPFPRELREEIYPTLEQLQDRLGEIHDHVVATDRLHNWIADIRGKREADHVHKLLSEEGEKLDQLMEDYVSWWTPQVASQFEHDFKRLLGHTKGSGLFV